jgi:hypothetical protein
MSEGGMKDSLLALHRGLHGVGSFVAKLCILALVAGLFFAPVFAMLFVSMTGAIWLGHFFNKAELVWAIAFFVIMGLIGSYVAPYIQPQIRAALMALLAEPQSPPEKDGPEPGLK